jgi:glycine/D-amino acid oxidase-like deaminating enzyme
VANYVEATGFIRERGIVGGITAQDTLSGQALDVRGSVVVNCTGAWSEMLLRPSDGPREAPQFPLSYAVNVVTRQIWPGTAVGLPVRLAIRDEAGNPRGHATVRLSGQSIGSIKVRPRRWRCLRH